MTGQRGLEPGLYEHVLTRALERAITGLGDRAVTASLVGPEGRAALARHAAALLARAMRDLADNDGPEPAQLANRVAALLRRASEASFGADDDDVSLPPRMLKEVLGPARPDGGHARLARPSVPLTESALFVNGRDDPGVGNEVILELASAADVDVIIPFVRWTGVRIVRDALAALVARGGRLRVIASTYLGSSEAKALEALVDLGGQVRVSYDTGATRLHAKAWLFERRTGISTALIGSSNLSRTALLDGLEWNVRVSETDVAPVLDTFRAAFETYWEDDRVEPYERRRFATAIGREASPRTVDLAPFEIHPFPHQRRILDDLDVQRQRHGRHRNLVVAATGTGKTVVAALDYRRLRGRLGDDPSLLFVAHRKEIL